MSFKEFMDADWFVQLPEQKINGLSLASFGNTCYFYFSNALRLQVRMKPFCAAYCTKK